MDPKTDIFKLITSFSIAADGLSKAAIGLQSAVEAFSHLNGQTSSNTLVAQQQVLDAQEKLQQVLSDKENLTVSVSTDVPSTSAVGAQASSSKPLKKKKDPNAPKPPPNAYAIYSKEHWKHLKEEAGAGSEKRVFQDVSKDICEKWKSLTGDEKKVNLDLLIL